MCTSRPALSSNDEKSGPLPHAQLPMGRELFLSNWSRMDPALARTQIATQQSASFLSPSRTAWLVMSVKKRPHKEWFDAKLCFARCLTEEQAVLLLCKHEPAIVCSSLFSRGGELKPYLLG
jgi:hypothetical protein